MYTIYGMHASTLLTHVWLLVDTFQALQKIKLNVMKCKQQETIYIDAKCFHKLLRQTVLFVVVVLVTFSFQFFHSFSSFLFLSSVLICNKKNIHNFFGVAHLNNQFVTTFSTTQLKMQLVFCHRQPKKKKKQSN